MVLALVAIDEARADEAVGGVEEEDGRAEAEEEKGRRLKAANM